MYNVSEDGGLIQICAAILVPADINTLDQSFELDLLFSVESRNATGTYVEPFTFSIPKVTLSSALKLKQIRIHTW